ncbi:hypothetical protein [Sphingobacterium lactis]|uniref:Uncharacterized protein n=1 Tax=Sphingobacterium lactis TaxID=797291 RepID=A0A1H5TYS7_9SPHI|nr:hypothetical protein [Sphingobacterium lactis]SEF67328.1 hypothetical protein SAMN05421877_102106 [Sphingobacterium lactis]
MDNIIQSLKEFIWEIVGFLVPGLFLIILSNFLISTENQIKNNFLFDWDAFEHSLIIIQGYIFGYIIYSLTKYKVYIQDKIIDYLFYIAKSNKNMINDYVNKKIIKFIYRFLYIRHSSYWHKDFQKSELYKAVLQKYRSEISNIDSMNVNEVRNILMTKNDKQSQVIYTFIFRSSMFDHISTVFILIIVTLFVQGIFNISLLKVGKPYNYIYFIMIILIPLLGNSKRFFFPKAIRVPFSNI